MHPEHTPRLTLTLDLDDEVLREQPLRAHWLTIMSGELVTRRLVDFDSGEELDRCHLWDNERAWDSSALVEMGIEDRWVARGYSIVDADD